MTRRQFLKLSGADINSVRAAAKMGLGWGIANGNGEDSFWHWGDNVPFHAFAAGFRKQRTGIVAMTNSESGRSIWKDLIPESIGGEHPELSWLKDLYEQMPRVALERP